MSQKEIDHIEESIAVICEAVKEPMDSDDRAFLNAHRNDLRQRLAMLRGQPPSLNDNQQSKG